MVGEGLVSYPDPTPKTGEGLSRIANIQYTGVKIGSLYVTAFFHLINGGTTSGKFL